MLETAPISNKAGCRKADAIFPQSNGGWTVILGPKGDHMPIGLPKITACPSSNGGRSGLLDWACDKDNGRLQPDRVMMNHSNPLCPSSGGRRGGYGQ